MVTACLEHGVQRLVYTSSIEAVIGGKPMIDADETAPYVNPGEAWKGPYGETKAAAEKTVLKANGARWKTGKGKLSLVKYDDVVVHLCQTDDAVIFLGSCHRQCYHNTMTQYLHEVANYKYWMK